MNQQIISGSSPSSLQRYRAIYLYKLDQTKFLKTIFKYLLLFIYTNSVVSKMYARHFTEYDKPDSCPTELTICSTKMCGQSLEHKGVWFLASLPEPLSFWECKVGMISLIMQWGKVLLHFSVTSGCWEENLILEWCSSSLKSFFWCKERKR